MHLCELCPRMCGVNRKGGERGYCGCGSTMRVARIALHPYEEPPISGSRGSGTVFFTGCSLRCVFCQNQDISRGAAEGKEFSPGELAGQLLALEEQGAHNINLVTPTHFADRIAETLKLARPHLHIPVVYNSSGYERVETLQCLDGLVDIYLPDFKYVSPELAQRYSDAPAYADIATDALREMFRQVGKPVFGSGDMLCRGVLVRHLVLPGCRKDSIAVLEKLRKLFLPDEILISVMSQYTPEFAKGAPDKALYRRLTDFEYKSVTEVAERLGFSGFFQERSSASAAYTPEFGAKEIPYFSFEKEK